MICFWSRHCALLTRRLSFYRPVVAGVTSCLELRRSRPPRKSARPVPAPARCRAGRRGRSVADPKSDDRDGRGDASHPQGWRRIPATCAKCPGHAAGVYAGERPATSAADGDRDPWPNGHPRSGQADRRPMIVDLVAALGLLSRTRPRTTRWSICRPSTWPT